MKGETETCCYEEKEKTNNFYVSPKYGDINITFNQYPFLAHFYTSERFQDRGKFSPTVLAFKIHIFSQDANMKTCLIYHQFPHHPPKKDTLTHH